MDGRPSRARPLSLYPAVRSACSHSGFVVRRKMNYATCACARRMTPRSRRRAALAPLATGARVQPAGTRRLEA